MIIKRSGDINKAESEGVSIEMDRWELLPRPFTANRTFVNKIVGKRLKPDKKSKGKWGEEITII